MQLVTLMDHQRTLTFPFSKQRLPRATKDAAGASLLSSMCREGQEGSWMFLVSTQASPDLVSLCKVSPLEMLQRHSQGITASSALCEKDGLQNTAKSVLKIVFKLFHLQNTQLLFKIHVLI